MSVPELAAILSQYAAAILGGDREALDVLLDADYQFVSAQARVVDRDRRLTTLTASPQILTRLTFSDADVRITDTVAIVQAAFTAEFKAHTGRTKPDRGISTLVFFYRHGHWRLRHQHNSHLP